MSKPSLWIASLMLAVALPATAEAPRSSITEWVACMQANVPEGVYQQDVSMVTEEDLGSRTELQGQLYVSRQQRDELDNVMGLFKLTAPAKLAGASYLVRRNEEDRKEGVYVYLPAVKRVRRVSGVFADGAMMGTAFSYSDFRLMLRIFNDVEISIEEQSEIDGRPVQALLVKTVVEDLARQDTLKLWVDQETCVGLKGEFRRQGTLHKKLTIDPASVSRSGKGWWAKKLTVRDDVNSRQTTIEFDNRKQVSSPGAGLFDPRRFYQ